MKKKDVIVPEETELTEAPATEEKATGSGFDIIGIIRPALVLLLVTGITVLLLALVNYVTKTPIAERKQAELDETVGAMFSDAEYKEIADYEFAEPVKTVYAILDGESNINGFCIVTVPQGFGGDVEMLVGVDTELSVVGVKITEDAETASKSKPVKEKLSQYEGKTGKFEFGKDGVDAVSGSTVTSKAVLSGVNSAVGAAEDYLDFRREKAKEVE